MADLSIWRTNLKTHLREFAALSQEDRSVDLIYGITAAAVLWHVRDAPNDEGHLALLRAACGDEQHVTSLKRALGGWDAMSPLEAARGLAKRQRADEGLHAAIEALLGHFLQDLFAENMLKQGLTIEGDVSGANVLIGSQQVVAGDLIIQYIRQSVSTCPTAPNPPAHFTGREKELEELRQALSGSGAVAITAVRSMGGMGKTALAQAFCHHPDNAFDAVLWARIGEDPQATSILLEWARYAVDDYALKPDAKPGEIAAWVRAQFSQLMEKPGGCGKHWLVVFDDVWNKQICYDTVALLQTALPNSVKTLITTRQVDAATALHAHSIELYELSDADALGLLQRLRDNRHLTDEHLQRAVSLIKGHPLTLEIAIASLNEAEDLDDIEGILDEYERGIRDGSPFDALDLGVETPRMLNVVFGRSYQALHEDNQRNFRALGILAADSVWERPLAGALWELSDQDAVTKAHKVLRLAALIQQDEEAEKIYSGVWYRQHPLLRAYARALLNSQNETDAIFGRYADRVIEIARQFDWLPLEQWAALAPHVPHVHAVGDALAPRILMAHKIDETLAAQAREFSRSTMRYLTHRPEAFFKGTDDQRTPERLNWLEMGLRVWRTVGDLGGEAAMLNILGTAWSALGERRKALDYFEQARHLLHAVGDRGGEGVTLNNIGTAWSDLGEQRKALEYYRQSLHLLRGVGDRGGEANTLNNIGTVWWALGEQRKALEHYEQALSLRRAVGDRGGEANTLTNIGVAWSALGEQRKALEYYEQALPLRRAMGDRGGEANTLNNIGGAWSALGEQRKALEHYEQALPVQRAVGDRGGEAATLNNIGGVWSDLGEKRQALEFYEQALPLLRAVEDRGGEANTLTNIGAAWSALGKQRKALDYFEQALPLWCAVDDRGGGANTLNNIGGVWSALGEKRKALEYYEQALPICRAVEDRGGEAVTLNNIGGVWSDLGEKRKALDYFEQALPLLRVVEDRRKEAFTLTNLGSVWLTLGEKRKALDYFEQALPLWCAVDDRGGEAITCYYIGTAYHARGDLDKAIEYLDRCAELGEQIDHPYLESSRSMLERLKRERERGASPEAGAPLILPPGDVNTMAHNTVVVKTLVSEKRDEWRAKLHEIRSAVAERGPDWASSVAFAGALLAVLDDQPAEMLEGNPYASVVRQVVEAIEEFRRNQP